MEKQGEEDNPFSYKAFLKRSADEPSEKKKKKGKKKASQKTQTQPSTAPTSQGQGIRILSVYLTHQSVFTTGDNPFSFKNFVASRVGDDTPKVMFTPSENTLMLTSEVHRGVIEARKLKTALIISYHMVEHIGK